MHRGRAAMKLVNKAEKKPWSEFKECPYENIKIQNELISTLLLHSLCQGIAIGISKGGG